MLDTLYQICEVNDRLEEVNYARYAGDGDVTFLSAIALRFGGICVVFRAVEENDALSAAIGPLVAHPDEELIRANGEFPWSSCIGLPLRWAWRLTNQRGYDDGVRLEFSDPDRTDQTIVEFEVAASSIKIFVASRGDPI